MQIKPLTASILAWQDLEGQPQEQALPEGNLEIGRHPANDVVIADPTVSRRHATIIFQYLRHYLIDLSTLGTWLNAKRLPPNEAHLLNDLDVIRVGPISFTFHDPGKTFSQSELEEALHPPFSPNAAITSSQSGNNGAGPTGLETASEEWLKVNLETGEVQLGGLEVALTPKEFSLLALLYQHPERACIRSEIRRAVWPERDSQNEGAVSDEEIDGLVRRLRHKIEPDRARPRYIVTVRQVRGYRFKTP